MSPNDSTSTGADMPSHNGVPRIHCEIHYPDTGFASDLHTTFIIGIQHELSIGAHGLGDNRVQPHESQRGVNVLRAMVTDMSNHDDIGTVITQARTKKSLVAYFQ